MVYNMPIPVYEGFGVSYGVIVVPNAWQNQLYGCLRADSRHVEVRRGRSTAQKAPWGRERTGDWGLSFRLPSSPVPQTSVLFNFS